MDGVFDMQAFYTRGGFVLHSRDLRFEGVGAAASSADGVVDLSTISFFDRDFPDERGATCALPHNPVSSDTGFLPLTD